MVIGYTDKLKQPFFLSDEDADLSQIKWHLDSNGYVSRSIYQQHKSTKREHLHVIIAERMNIEKKDVFDHINRNKTDNQRENLRSVTYSQNSLNKKMKKPSVSGVQGVTKDSNRNQWRAHITIKGKIMRKTFNDFWSAICWRDEMEKLYV